MSQMKCRWFGSAGLTLLVVLGALLVGSTSSRANQAPDTDGGENSVSIGDLRLPPPGGNGPGSDDGATDGIRQGADPNDFSVSSPRRPVVQTNPTERTDGLTSLRLWVQNLVHRILGIVRRV